ncbi:hypothetical protein JCM17823_22180 [Halorubrum gandharaense]
MSEKRTRRAALGLMAAGGALVAADTRAFTSLLADRVLDVEVADDREDAAIGIRNETLVGGHTYDELPHRIELRNNFEEPVTMTASVGNDFSIVDEGGDSWTDADLGPDEETSLQIDVDGPDGATDVVELTAAGDSATAELDREITLDGFEPSDNDEELHVWLDATAEDTIEESTDGHSVSDWESRNEENLSDGVDVEDNGTPQYDTDGLNGNSTVAFDEDEYLIGDSIDLSDTGEPSMTVFFVLDVEGGAYPLTFEDDNEVRFDIDEDDEGGEVVAEFSQPENGTETVRLDTELAGETLVTFVIEGEVNEGGNDSDLEMTTYLDGDMADEGDLTMNGTGLGDFTIGLGADQDGNEGFEGDIAELLVYEVAKADADREDVESYLADKWGLDGP